MSLPHPRAAQAAGIATVFQDLALCDNLDVVANLFLGQERTRTGVLDEVDMEREAWGLLKQLSAKIPSVRIPVAGLSGGQRQTVAIARSLVGRPRLVMLDEPTVALGVAQTAEVLNLIERLRDQGLGVLLITHNMADVQAVADRVVVLRLGRNAVDLGADATTEQLVAAITGADDNVVAAARAAQRRPAVPRSRTDERPREGRRRGRLRRGLRPVRRAAGPPGRARGAVVDFRQRIAGGDLGNVPVVLGLIAIAVVFYIQDKTYLSSSNLVNITLSAVPYGVISLGIVLVLLLGEIDLSVGSISGLAASITAVLFVNQGWPLLGGIAVGVGAGLAIGLLYGLLYTKVGVPSFVITLAGLLAFYGLQLTCWATTAPSTSPGSRAWPSSPGPAS